MFSKQFMIELPEEVDEFDIYEALRNFGINYARVKPAVPYLCREQPEVELYRNAGHRCRDQ